MVFGKTDRIGPEIPELEFRPEIETPTYSQFFFNGALKNTGSLAKVEHTFNFQWSIEKNCLKGFFLHGWSHELVQEAQVPQSS